MTSPSSFLASHDYDEGGEPKPVFNESTTGTPTKLTVSVFATIHIFVLACTFSCLHVNLGNHARIRTLGAAAKYSVKSMYYIFYLLSLYIMRLRAGYRRGDDDVRCSRNIWSLAVSPPRSKVCT